MPGFSKVIIILHSAFYILHYPFYIKNEHTARR